MQHFGLTDLYTILIGTVAAGAVFVAAPWLWARVRAMQYTDRRRPSYHVVKPSAERDTIVMSRSEYQALVDRLSSQDGQRDGRTDSAPPSRDDLITLYRILRKYGVPREEIRAALKGVRVPLSNDVWAAAAPAEPPAQYVTPIVGRPTSAQFDPDFPYVAPPS